MGSKTNRNKTKNARAIATATNEEKTDKALRSIYYNLDNPASYSTAEKLFRAVARKIPLEAIKEWLSRQNAYTLHKAARRNYPRNHYNVSTIFEQFQADLMDNASLADANSGYRYILFVIDSFSRYVWTRALKQKSATEVFNAFKSIIEEAGKFPAQLVTDRGKEFYNSKLSTFLKSNGCNHFSPSNDQFKASIAERGIRTFKGIMHKALTANLTHRYLEIIPKITKSMNERVHRIIGVAPRDVNESNSLLIWTRLQLKRMRERRKKQKIPSDIIKPGDHVRIAKNKNTNMMDKGFLPNWSDEIFKVTRNIPRNPQIYNLEDDAKEKVEGAFYKEEVQKIKKDKNTLYRVERVLKRRTRKGIREVFVEWSGFSSKHNCWIPQKDLIE